MQNEGVNSYESGCPLCTTEARHVVRFFERDFHHCPTCDLVFVPTRQHVDDETARRRYLTHRNDARQAGYVTMLSTVVDILRDVAPPGLCVLDYGCGHTPVLVDLLRRAGHDATGYDPFFARHADLSHSFDAVVSVETFEHFARPREDVSRVVSLVRPGGWLVVMTQLHAGPDSIEGWWYARDPTHVAFYSRRTFQWLGQAFGLKVIDHYARGCTALRRDVDERLSAAPSRLMDWACFD